MEPKEISEFIDEILAKLGQLLDASGLKKALLAVEIMQMLNAINEGAEQQKKVHALEKQALLDQLRQMQMIQEKAEAGDEVIPGQVYRLDLSGLTEKDGAEE